VGYEVAIFARFNDDLDVHEYEIITRSLLSEASAAQGESRSVLLYSNGARRSQSVSHAQPLNPS
jgi:hypothetical protein